MSSCGQPVSIMALFSPATSCLPLPQAARLANIAAAPSRILSNDSYEYNRTGGGGDSSATSFGRHATAMAACRAFQLRSARLACSLLHAALKFWPVAKLRSAPSAARNACGKGRCASSRGSGGKQPAAKAASALASLPMTTRESAFATSVATLAGACSSATSGGRLPAATRASHRVSLPAARLRTACAASCASAHDGCYSSATSGGRQSAATRASHRPSLFAAR